MADEASRCSSSASSMSCRSCEHPADISRHLREYFGEARACRRLAAPARRLVAARRDSVAQFARLERPSATRPGWPASSSPARISTKPSHAVAAPAAQARLHRRSARRSDASPRTKPTRYQERIPRPHRGARAEVNAWPEDRPHRPRRPRRPRRASTCRSSFVALQPVRPDRSRRHERGRAGAAAADLPRWPGSTGRSSTSTWSSTPSRT